MVVLRNQKSEPKEVAVMEFAVVKGSWFSIELLGSLVRSGGEQARVDSAAAAIVNSFLRSILHFLLWCCN